MKVTINDYELIRQAGSNALYQLYSGHHIKRPDQKCRVEAIYDQNVPLCYKSFVVTGQQSLKLNQPHFLLKEVFVNPQCCSQFVFVEIENQKKYQPLSLANEQLPDDKERSQLKKRLLWILRIVRLVPIVMKSKVMHDFAFSKIYCDEEDNIYLGKFIKDRKGKKQFTQSEIEKNINQIISTLMKEYNSKQIGHITFSIANSLSHLKIVSEDELQGVKMSTKMTLSFEGKDCYIEAEHFMNQKLDIQQSCWVVYDKMHTLSHGIVAHQFGKIEGSNNFVSQQNCNKGNSDDNIEIIDMNNLVYPANLIGAIISKMKAEKTKSFMPFVSTGILISKNLVATCAHSIKTKCNGQRYQLICLQDIKFVLNRKQYKVKAYRFPQKYSPKHQKDRQYDYALLKLEEDIVMNSYIEIVKNYDKNEIGASLKGYRQNLDNKIQSKVVKSKQLSFKEKRIIFKGEKSNHPQSGFSGTPLFITAIQIDGVANYYFMIGIFYGKNINEENQFQANQFNDENIQTFAHWQKQMANKQEEKDRKIFSNIFSFKNILNMDTQLLQFKKRIEDIKFNDDQITYFSKMFSRINFDKELSGQKVENKYFHQSFIDEKKLNPYQVSKILCNIGSQTQLQRYNNIAFMYSLRKYQEWHLEFFVISDRHGLFIITNYIFKRLVYFFKKAAVKNQHKKQYTQFLNNCQTVVEQIYRRKKRNKVVRQKCYQMLLLVQQILEKVPLNSNFKKILLLQKDYAISVMLKFNKDIEQLFHLPKLLMYVFIAKMAYQKIAELDQGLRFYFFILKSMLSICLKKLSKQEKHYQTRFKEIAHNFLWGAKEMITTDNLKQLPPIFGFQVHPLAAFSQQIFDSYIQQQYFSQDMWDYLKSYLERKKQPGDQD